MNSSSRSLPSSEAEFLEASMASVFRKLVGSQEKQVNATYLNMGAARNSRPGGSITLLPERIESMGGVLKLGHYQRTQWVD